jgi:hypothetical protein
MVKWRDVELPGFEGQLTVVKPKRRRALAAYVRDFLAELPSPAAEESLPVAEPTESSADAATACAVCNGHCCRLGGERAFLNRDAVAEVWSRLPHLSKEELVSAYLAAVPQRTFEDSCIFHGAHGCNLPRTMRSYVCINYMCSALEKLVAPASAANSIQACGGASGEPGKRPARSRARAG